MKVSTQLGRSNARSGAISIFAVLVLAVTAAAQTSIFSVQKTPNPNVRGKILNAVAATLDFWEFPRC